MTALRDLLAITTGGTISSVITNNGEYDAAPDLINRMLFETLGENVKISAPFCILSENIAIEHYLLLKAEIEKGMRAGFDKFVITHGSDTLMYTAYFLAFCFSDKKISIAVVAANIPPFDANSDAQNNLSLAVNAIKAQKGIFVSYEGLNKVEVPPLSKDFVFGQKNNVLLIKSHPAIDYSLYNFTTKKPDLVVIEAFHSGTVPNGTLRFLDECEKLGIDVIVTPTFSRKYLGTVELAKKPNVFILNLPTPAAYILATFFYRKRLLS